MYSSLSSFNVLITGAAGRIGSAAARKLLESGTTVIITDIDEKKLYKLQEELGKDFANAKIVGIVADITNPNKIDELIEQAKSKVGCINGAVHSAYPTTRSWGRSIEGLEMKNLTENLSMQLGGGLIFSQAILQHFCDNNGGNLVHISSIQGIMAPKFEHYQGTNMTSPVEYSSIKAGIIAATKWLAKYYFNKNIRVNCVSPGGILDNQNPTFLANYRKSCNNIGMLSAEDISKVIAFLLSNDAAAITGQTIIVDDGWSLCWLKQYSERF